MMKTLGIKLIKWKNEKDLYPIEKLSRIERKKCPECNNPMKKNSPLQKCGECGHLLMNSDIEYLSYLVYIHKRYIFQSIPVCIFLSFFPLIGAIIGHFYIKNAIIRPFKLYLPLIENIKTKLYLKIFILLLTIFQFIPAYGVISVPLIAYLKYRFYMNTFAKFARPN
ncbi:MAG TPA: hypothetical protein P5105_06470 [Victivallales bacterium]|nr:hypothetical protein [Victivallales bacterium]